MTQNHGRAIPSGHIDPARRTDRRRKDEVTDAFEPERIAERTARRRIQARQHILIVTKKIERVIVEQRGRDVGSQPVQPPRHPVGAGDITFRSLQPDRDHRLLIIAIAGDHDPAVVDRRGHHIVGKAGTFPEQFTGRQIVAPHAFRGADDYLLSVTVLHHERSGPGGLLVPRHFPTLLTGLPVEGVQERLALVIPAHHQEVTRHHGRTSFTVGVERVHTPQILLPKHRPVEIKAVKTVRTEERIQPLAVGDRGV